MRLLDMHTHISRLDDRDILITPCLQNKKGEVTCTKTGGDDVDL